MSDPVSTVLAIGCQLHGAKPGDYCRDFMVCGVRINHSLGYAVAEWVGDGYAVRTHEDIVDAALAKAREFYGPDYATWGEMELRQTLVLAIDMFKRRPVPPVR